jgi:hypothetical protein
VTINIPRQILVFDISQERRVVTTMFKQALAYFRKTWTQLRNPYRPERHYMRGSQQARSGK